MRSMLWLGALLLTACGGDPIERAYDHCVDRLEVQLAEAEKEADRQDNKPAQMIAQTAVEAGRKIGMAACEGMREQCRADPDGAICKAAIKTYAED